MYSIKDAEQMTGITKQNIRYYEKQGLLKPVRNRENDYREYSDEDIRRLKIIRLFRMLDMPLEEIRKLLEHQLSLPEAVSAQQERLQKEREQLTDAIHFCSRITDQDLDSLNVEDYLGQMEEEEKRGAVFSDFLNDFARVYRAETERAFTIHPDTMCLNPREFTDALFAYANENHLDLTVTKEGMNPEFLLNGIEYTASRSFGRFGAVIHCEMKHPEDYMPEGMPQKRYSRISFFLRSLVGLVLFLYIFLVTVRSTEDLIAVIPAAVLLIAYFYYVFHVK